MLGQNVDTLLKFIFKIKNMCELLNFCLTRRFKYVGNVLPICIYTKISLYEKNYCFDFYINCHIKVGNLELALGFFHV